MSESGEFSCKRMKERQLMGEFQRGGGGGWGVGGGGGGAGSPDPPLKNHQNRVSMHTSPVPLKITKLPSE